MRASGGRRWGLAGLALLLGLALAPRAAADSRVEATLVSQRGRSVHLELSSPVSAGGERLVAGQQVQVTPAEGEAFQAKLIAASSRFLVLELPEGTELSGPVSVAGASARPRRRDPLPQQKAPAAASSSPVKVGRKPPTLRSFKAKATPKRELIPFRGAVRKKVDASATAGPGGAEELEPLEPRVDADGNELTAKGRIANQIVGEVAVGVDSFYDDELDIERNTPYARVRFEVRQLGGSDRLSFRLYGSIRRPIDSTDDWTGHNSDQLNARLTFLSLELESAQAGEIQDFSDRVEFAVGRTTIPGVLDAGIVDGVRFGVRGGPVTAFAFGGAASSLNPRNEDYESYIYGGGVRFDQAFSHSGAIRISLAAAQERYESDGERDFIESQLDLRYGLFGVRGRLVVDFFEPLRDKRDTRVTTGALNFYAQVSRAVRLEAGYRERRAQYQRELLTEDLFAEALAALDKTARRNIYGGIRFSLFDAAFQFWVRGEVYEGRGARESNGGVLGFTLRLNPKHRILAEFAWRRRYRSDSDVSKSNDPFIGLSWLYQGDSLMSQLGVVYRDSFPKSADDRRIALRLFLDYEIGAGFGVRGYGEVDFRRDHFTDDDGIAAFGGLGARYRF